jgi:hypothetical protein
MLLRWSAEDAKRKWRARGTLITDCQYCQNPRVEILSKAEDLLCVKGNVFRLSDVFYVASSDRLVQDNEQNFLSQGKISLFEKFRTGQAKRKKKEFGALVDVCSLYKLEVLAGKIQSCTCKAYQALCRCSHSAAVNHILKNINVFSLLSDVVPKKGKRGSSLSSSKISLMLISATIFKLVDMHAEMNS